jgi:hypothetical protein
MIDLYQLLGISRGATREEIRSAYRSKAKLSHPDSGGSVDAFSKLATAHEILSDERRRERYDETGVVEPARPDNSDASAIEVIAQKIGHIIHAEHDVTTLDIDLLLEGAIRDDIASRQASIAEQKRAIERAGKLRARVKRKGAGGDNMLARVLDWHERSAADLIKRNEDAVLAMERALDILQGYSFTDDFAQARDQMREEVSAALRDTLKSLDELAAILSAEPAAMG